MKEKTVRKLNLIILILFPIMLLVFSITYNIYSVGTENRIRRELENFTNSLSLRMESKYMDMMTLYFKEELNNYAIANEFTNLVKEQVRLGITPHFNSLKFSVYYTMKNNVRTTTYALLFIAVLMFILTLVINFTNNNINNTSYVSPPINNVNDNVKEDIQKPSNPIGSMIDSYSSEAIRLEIEEMYKKLVKEMKSSRDDQALEIIEKMFQLDDRNHLALNGAGILYTKMYGRENKDEYFKKANEYFQYALSLYTNNESVSNNKAILYSVRYELKKSEEDYETALIIFNDALSANHLDVELLNNRATLYSVKYKIGGDENIFSRSLNDYDELIKIDYNNIYALNNRSALYFTKYKNSGDKKYFDKSIEDCNTAFKINSAEAPYDNRGSLYIYKY
ncbi:tetratricopeptide repeat protein [Brachyspira intermedia]|uniref:tetratricopeptide repeat protein n=1 Tax=Brachyspira intermedia TaxID=84377 RepID=UPI003005152B